MKITEYQYLWPPRPETKIAPTMLNFYKNRGWQAQIKKNGTCTVIFARGNEVIFKTRHNDNHKLWTPLKEHVGFFQSSSTAWNVYVAELLHSKTPHIKNQLYIFDKIVHDGIHLVGRTFEERQRIIADQWEGDEERDQYRITPYVSRAKNFSDSFGDLWSNLEKEDEGLVLKDPKAKLIACLKPTSNAGWQVKCRIPHKNYGF